MMMTSHCERLLEVSSMLWDWTQRSCMIRIVTVESAGFSSHGESTTVDTSDQTRCRRHRDAHVVNVILFRQKMAVQKELNGLTEKKKKNVTDDDVNVATMSSHSNHLGCTKRWLFISLAMNLCFLFTI